MSSPNGALARAAAWDIPIATTGTRSCTALVVAALLVPAVLFAALGYLVMGLPGLLPGVVALAVAALVLRTATRVSEETLAPEPAHDARLLNIVRGLSRDLGIDPPPAYLLRGEGSNAAVFWRSGGPAVGVTRATLEEMTRTELEAVIAHCLVRLDPEAGLNRASLTLGGTFGACASAPTLIDDARTAATTRYPPALMEAIGKATPAGGRFSYLWFVGDGPSAVPVSARLDALAQL